MIRLSPIVRPALVSMALLYLLCPAVLFLFGWVEQLVAWPLAIALAVGAVMAAWAVPRVGLDVRRRDLLGWVATLAGCLVVFELLAGFFGQAPQPGDFPVRNALYETLIRCDWPLRSAQGEYLVYYHCFWLPPALAAKLCGHIANPWLLLYAWCFLGVALGFSLFFLKLKGRVLGLFLLLCLMGCVTEWAGTGGTGFLAAHNMDAAAHALDELFPVHNMSYVAWCAQVTWCYNHAIPLCVLVALLLSGSLPLLHRPYAAALALPASPLGSLAVLPLLVLQLIGGGNLRRVLVCRSLWLAIPFVAVVALYFSMGEGAEPGTVFPLLGNRAVLQALLVCVCWTLLPACVFLWPYRKTSCFVTAFILCLLLPCVIIGAPEPDGLLGVRNNELLFKGSLPMFLCLAWLYLRRFRHASRALRFAMAFYICASCGTIFWRGLKGINHYTVDPVRMKQNIRNEWNGHLDHPEDTLYRSFWSSRPTFVPKLFRQ